MENCVFCKITRGNLPYYKVWEDKDHLAFLSIFPIKPGHVLVIPKKHTGYFFDIGDMELSGLIIAAKKVATQIKVKLNPKTGKVGVLIAGIEVEHAHIHLVPMDNEGELTFKYAKPATNEELERVSALLKVN